MADRGERVSPAKRCRFSTSTEDSCSSHQDQEPIHGVRRLGSCEMFNAGDSGFSELTSAGGSEDEVQTAEQVTPSNNHEDTICNDEDETASTVTDVSDISGLSDLSSHDWEPTSGSMAWVHQQMMLGTNPRSLLAELVPNAAQIPEHLDDVTLWKIIVNIISEPPRRQRLRHVNSLADVVRLLRSCKKIIVLTGAGVSVSCGIPDFRSRDGIYARLAVDFPDLPDPQAMFDIHYFHKDPRPFFKFARDLWPGQFTPSKCHRFIRLLEKHNKLLRNYTQNIDTLEQQAGIQNVIQCHGSFATATCLRCKYRVPAAVIEPDIMEQKIPLCTQCSKPSEMVTLENGIGEPNSIMKPDIVFFGEGMPEEFHRSMTEDKEECDLIIVIGSSLKVRPVALIPSALPSHVPQILINREPLRHMVFDVELLGDCDIIVNQLCHMLGTSWKDDVCYRPPLKEIVRLPPQSSAIPSVSSFTPKKLQLDPARRDSGLSSASSELEIVENELDASSSNTENQMVGWWQPRITANVADLLPSDSYLFAHPGRYVFPGAELYYDPDEVGSDSDSSSSSSDFSDSSGIDTDPICPNSSNHGIKRKCID